MDYNDFSKETSKIVFTTPIYNGECIKTVILLNNGDKFEYVGLFILTKKDIKTYWKYGFKPENNYSWYYLFDLIRYHQLTEKNNSTFVSSTLQIFIINKIRELISNPIVYVGESPVVYQYNYDSLISVASIISRLIINSFCNNVKERRKIQNENNNENI